MYYDRSCHLLFFFFNDTATTEIYTLSLHDALPICFFSSHFSFRWRQVRLYQGKKSGGDDNNNMVTGLEWTHHPVRERISWEDRKSTRLNSSHANISYAVFCLKKKKKRPTIIQSHKK